ncbi:MAG: small multi-drug export protein [Arcobacteraceae bacterium]|nr:small multi-drug export protein [Arcobacteraceae bacterium]MDY0327324.1 small multi-drug export protein [Arcobacteraceae bacterium]
MDLNKIESKLLLMGLSLLLVLLGSLGVVALFDIELASKLLGIAITNLIVGRMGGLSFGFASGIDFSVVLFVNLYFEVLLVLIVYSLFVMSWENAVKFKRLEHFFDVVKAFVAKHHDKFDKYGTYGIFFFVFFPLFMSGPVVGAIIGFIIGIRHIKNIFIVLSSTFIATTLWALFLNEIVTILNNLNQYASWGILIVLIIVALIARKRKK